MTRRSLQPDSRTLLVLLAALMALGPLSVDMYLPAMPFMMEDFGTSVGAIHLTMSTYLVGFAVCHLICGPLADRLGRKSVLLGGTLIFVTACVACSRSESVTEMLVFRFFQGVGACVGPTLARTVARDVFGPTGAARALSLIAMIMALGPAIAPALVGVMLAFLPWRGIFYSLATYGVLMLLCVHFLLAESLPAHQSLHPLAIARNFGRLLSDPHFLVPAGASAMMSCGMMTYLSCSSFVYISMLGLPVQLYGLIFFTSVAGYILGSYLSARISLHQDSARIILLGGVLGFASTLAMLLGHLSWPESIAALVLPAAVFFAALGLVIPHSMAVALQYYPLMAGTTSALLGFIQMSLSAAATAVAGQMLTDTPLPMVWMMLVLTGLGMVLCATVRRLPVQ